MRFFEFFWNCNKTIYVEDKWNLIIFQIGGSNLQLFLLIKIFFWFIVYQIFWFFWKFWKRPHYIIFIDKRKKFTNNGGYGSQLTYVKISSKSIHPISKYLAADIFWKLQISDIELDFTHLFYTLFSTKLTITKVPIKSYIS